MLILLGISAILYGIYILLTKKHSLLKNYWGIILILYNFVNHYTNFHTTVQILFYILLLLGLLFRIKNNNDHYK